MISTIKKMKYKLLQQFLDYPAGYIIHIKDNMGILGIDDWFIPLEIIQRNPKWFQLLTNQ